MEWKGSELTMMAQLLEILNHPVTSAIVDIAKTGVSAMCESHKQRSYDYYEKPRSAVSNSCCYLNTADSNRQIYEMCDRIERGVSGISYSNTGLTPPVSVPVMNQPMSLPQPMYGQMYQLPQPVVYQWPVQYVPVPMPVYIPIPVQMPIPAYR